ncbi:MAG: hypothetical protein WBA45_14820 [Microthrixaceae bacterium]
MQTERPEDFNLLAALASHADRTVENSVLPVFFPNLLGRMAQIGSGVLLRIGTEHFVLTASHVFDDIGTYGIGLGSPEQGHRIDAVGGTRFSKARGSSGTHQDDPIDAAVLHVGSPLTEAQRSVAVTLDNLDIDPVDQHRDMYATIGYRSRATKIRGGKARVSPEWRATREVVDDYAARGFDRSWQLAVRYAELEANGKSWRPFPKPEGMSGGAIVRFAGLSTPSQVLLVQSPKPLLSAVTVGHRKGEGKHRPAVLWGTRVMVHLALIREYLPQTPGLEPWLGPAPA